MAVDTKNQNHVSALALAVSALAGPWQAFAHEEHNASVIEEIVVYGRAEQSIGTAMSASEGLVGYDDWRMTPMQRVGDLAEAVPGMVATQHSGTGKANQYFLRGFNLDHGTDFAAYAEGVPLNMRTHGHGQGYLDLNFLIPELVATAQYRKGPYAAEVGDFSSAGSVAFQFHDRLDDSLIAATIGEDAYVRSLVAGSLDINGAAVTAAVDIARNDGPWDLDEDLDQQKLYLGYVRPTERGQIKLTLQGYSSEWTSTDQIPRRAVRSGIVDELGFLDPDLGGSTDRWVVTAAADFENWRISSYLIDYDFELFSNFTYLLDDPVQGDEFAQRDERRVYGATATASRTATLANRPLVWTWGGELRFDDIQALGLDRTVGRQAVSTTRRDAVKEASLGAYADAAWAATDKLRASLGVRVDAYDWDVDALQRANGGSGTDTLVSPKFSLAYRINELFEAYANYGHGMHSNDVRGVTIRVDPVSGDPVPSVDALVKSRGGEVGLRVERGTQLNATITAFWLTLDSELVFVGDAGGTEVNPGSRRQGVELTAFWNPNEWLALNASYTRTNAEFRSALSNADHIPGAIEGNLSFGVNGTWRNGLSASLQLRHIDEAPLVEDDSVRAPSSTALDASLMWRRGPLEWRVDVFNVLDSNDYDVAYFYPSRLPGENAEGIEDIHYHPFEPRSVRASMSFFF